MNIGEILVHLLGGAGMEYGARSRQTQQAGLQAKENALARAQERMLQGAGIRSQEKISGAELGSRERISGAEITSREKISGAQTSAQRDIASMQVEADKLIAENSLLSREKIAGGELRVRERMADKDRDYERWAEGMRGELTMSQLEVAWAGMNDQLPPGTIGSMIDMQRSRYLSVLQRDYGATPEEARAAYDEAREGIEPVLKARDVDFTLPGMTLIEQTYRDAYDRRVELDPGNEPELFKNMLLGIYNDTQARGLGKSEYAAALYELRFGVPIEEEAGKAREAEMGVGEEEGGPGFWERGGPMADMLGPLSYPYGAMMSGANALFGYPEAARRHLDVYEALVMGYTPSAYQAAAAQAKREGWKRTALEVLQEEFTPYTNLPRKGKSLTGAKKDLLGEGSMKTGAPTLE